MLFWFYLLIAILTEVVGTTLMKVSQGLTQLTLPSVFMFVYGVGFCLYGTGAQKIEVSTAYAIWLGLGTAMIAMIGVVVVTRSRSNLPNWWGWC